MTSDPIELLYYAGRALWARVFIGHPPPATIEMRQRMSNPRPGELVIEISGFGPFDPDRVGRLIRIERESMTVPERYIVEPLNRPGTEQGWRNAEFIALPDQRNSRRWAEAAAEQL